MNPIDFEDYSNPSEREEIVDKFKWDPHQKTNEYFFPKEKNIIVESIRPNQVVPFDPENRPDRLSQLIRDAEELFRDYAPEDDEPAPLWRDFVIVATQSLRTASKVWDLEIEVEEINND